MSALVLVSGCRDAAPPRNLNTVDVTVGRKSFHLAVAATYNARQYGLMNRESLPADQGMLFVFPEEEIRKFWMKNTLIPLDLIYLDSAGKVVSIKQGVPLDEKNEIPSDAPAKYVIELNKGAAAAAGLKAGDHVEIPSQVRDTFE